MCRNIKPLFNFEPPATDEEIRMAALQYVLKVSGFNISVAAEQGCGSREPAYLPRVSSMLDFASSRRDESRRCIRNLLSFLTWRIFSFQTGNVGQKFATIPDLGTCT